MESASLSLGVKLDSRQWSDAYGHMFFVACTKADKDEISRRDLADRERCATMACCRCVYIPISCFVKSFFNEWTCLVQLDLRTGVIRNFLSPKPPTPAQMLCKSTTLCLPSQSHTPTLLQDNNQQHQYNNQHNNRRNLPILHSLPTQPTQRLLRLIQARGMPIHQPIHLIQHGHLAIQLVSDLNTELALPSNRLA